MDTGNFLAQVQEGMKVYDRLHHEIGKVEYVKIGDDNPETPESEAAAPSNYRERDETLIDNLAEVFAPEDDVPEEMRDRLLLAGFVRIESKGLFASDRYVMPDQIMSVSGDTVTLNVSKDELVRKH